METCFSRYRARGEIRLLMSKFLAGSISMNGYETVSYLSPDISRKRVELLPL